MFITVRGFPNFKLNEILKKMFANYYHIKICLKYPRWNLMSFWLAILLWCAFWVSLIYGPPPQKSEVVRQQAKTKQNKQKRKTPEQSRTYVGCVYFGGFGYIPVVRPDMAALLLSF